MAAPYLDWAQTKWISCLDFFGWILTELSTSLYYQKWCAPGNAIWNHLALLLIRLNFRFLFYFRSNKMNILNVNMFKPFDLYIWIALLLLTLLISCVLSILFKCDGGRYQIINSCMLSIGGFCQQGFNHSMTLTSTRFLVLALLIAGLLFYNFYTSVLVSTIVGIKYETDIRDIDDLISKNMSIGIQNSTVIRSLLQVWLLPQVLIILLCNASPFLVHQG